MNIDEEDDKEKEGGVVNGINPLNCAISLEIDVSI